MAQENKFVVLGFKVAFNNVSVISGCTLVITVPWQALQWWVKLDRLYSTLYQLQ